MTSELSPLFLELLEKKNHQKDQAKCLGLKNIVKIVSERKIKGGEEKKEIRYYLSSLDEDASKLPHIISYHLTSPLFSSFLGESPSELF